MPFKAVFHAGELRAQQLAGTRGLAEEVSTIISNRLPASGRLDTFFHICDCYASPPFPLLQSVKSNMFGFLSSLGTTSAPSPSQLRIDQSGLAPQDILRDNILGRSDSPVGLLALDFLKGCRYRTNGIFHEWSSPQDSPRPGSSPVLDMSIREAFPNCKRYIQRRYIPSETAVFPHVPIGTIVETDCALSRADQALIFASDTTFLGTFHELTGADVSHRGGHPGFVRVVSENEIYWPDYHGNGMFQSFGNIQINKQAGLAFVDFSTGQVLQLSGWLSAIVEWEVDKDLNIGASAERMVRFCVEAV